MVDILSSLTIALRMEDLRDPAAGELELFCDDSTGHTRELEPHDLQVTGEAVIVAESFVLLGYRCSLTCPHWHR